MIQGCRWKRALPEGQLGGQSQMTGLLGPGTPESHGWQPVSLPAFYFAGEELSESGGRE